MQMKNNSLYDIWNQVPEDYYQKSIATSPLQRIWHGRKLSLAKELLKKLEFKNLLDVGCASGYMLSEIAKTSPGKQFFGVDIYDKAIKFAKIKYQNINFKVATARGLPFADNAFDVVICYETIEHVEDPLASLKEIRRVLKKGGTLILAMDSGNWLFRVIWFVWERTKGKVWRGSHLHPFHHNELESIVARAGFKIKRKIFSHWGMEVVFVLGR